MNIIIYSTPTCVYCKMAKQYFENNDLKYTEHNVAEDDSAREEMLQKSQQMGVPVIDINGKVLIGFNQVEIEQAIIDANQSE
ncbi:MAG: NrdH-redoxin [Candidatus Harrisonbacteria bacterium CG10_big_fil_rev_8_21_14_0_10_38_8]|uniref:NrdH-redoxin n=1 Tax=Candidatus Harrisonbacteria bacterium CG10_big_fil_rev_8_21_14_0_10_38_8 TaxID=1974582 RepID=A0A2M6WK46_9BACT|nr:MAG: NrdH-redoxin [Candidatus Harrisonbacteria bacterium CG10_big_fil_rev_8_21_14_0_10_38_8]